MVSPELLLVEKGIPLAWELFGFFDRIDQYDPAEGVENHPRTKQATALLIRSATKIRPEMESALPHLKIAGTTTAGNDHILPWPGLTVVSAPGCNAEAVADYVCYALFAMDGFADDLFKGKQFGVIGFGEVGSRVAGRMESLGFSVIRYDPPKAERAGDFQSAGWQEIRKCDYISIHTPLTYDGKYPTYNLLNHRFFEGIQPGTVLINCARGGVLDEKALLKYSDKLRYLILDVYKNEPSVNQALLSRADIATPHIAGYTSQAFVRGVIQVAGSFRDFFEIEPKLFIKSHSSPPLDEKRLLSPEKRDFHKVCFHGKKARDTDRYYQTEKKSFSQQIGHLEEIPKFLENIFSIRELSGRFKQAGKMEAGGYYRMRAQAIRSENSFMELSFPGDLPDKVKEVLAALNFQGWIN